MPLLNGLPANLGWRVAFGLGVVLGLVILLVRRHVPESPRWLFIHGRATRRSSSSTSSSRQVDRETGKDLAEVDSDDRDPAAQDHRLRARSRRRCSRATRSARRSGFSLFIGQAFLYNAITFGFAQILQTFFEVPSGNTGYYFAVIAVGNLLGPLLLGRLFDTVGRRLDDRRHVHRLRRAAARHRLAVRRRRTQRDHA